MGRESGSDGSDGQILVGVVGAPHGVRGEVRVKSYTAEPLALQGYGPLGVGDGAQRLVIRQARLLKDDLLVVRFAGVDTRDAAAALTHARLTIARSALPAAAEDEFYHADLIGLRAEAEDGALLGRVVAVPNYGGGDLLEIAGPGGDTRLVAFTVAFVPVIDVAGGRVLVAAAALAEGDDEDPTSEADRTEGLA